MSDDWEYAKERYFVDATPDQNYPLRILEAYRQDCDTRCSMTTTFDGVPETNPLIAKMNADQERRAVILDGAIALLRGELIGRYRDMEAENALLKAHIDSLLRVILEVLIHIGGVSSIVGPILRQIESERKEN